nr:MAG TPA: hypothetical protein [Caudoviricetes sp.]
MPPCSNCLFFDYTTKIRLFSLTANLQSNIFREK